MSAVKELQVEDFLKTISEISSESARRQLIEIISISSAMFRSGRESGYEEGFKAGRESAQEEE